MNQYKPDARLELSAEEMRDYGLQLTRGFRALKLWMSLKLFGLAARKMDWRQR